MLGQNSLQFLVHVSSVLYRHRLSLHLLTTNLVSAEHQQCETAHLQICITLQYKYPLIYTLTSFSGILIHILNITYIGLEARSPFLSFNTLYYQYLYFQYIPYNFKSRKTRTNLFLRKKISRIG